jgi:hypothetical protein
VHPTGKLTPLATAERERLARLLGMVGSAHDGEALNAARLADRFVRERGLTWPDVIAAPALTPPASDPPPPREPADDWRAAAAFCLRHGDTLTQWEAEFCLAVSKYRCAPSSKQLAILRRLLTRVMMAGAET